MGKDWDKVVIPSSTWKECLRVLKPGAFAFIMSAPRQDVLSKMICNLQEAVFKTDFSSIYWSYATGFPKPINISKTIDKRKGLKGKIIGKGQSGSPETHKSSYQMSQQENNTFGGEFDIIKPESEEAKQFDGSFGGFQPKPAVEIIIVCMKPLSEKTYVAQALNNGKGVTWLENCRMPYEKNYEPQKRGNLNPTSEERNYGYKDNVEIGSEKGRFPANLLVSDDVLNDGKISESKRKPINVNKAGIFLAKAGFIRNRINDSGSYSRYFDLDKWWSERIKNLPEEVKKVFPFLIVPKASKNEKNKGLDSLPKKQKIFNGQSNESSKDIKDVEKRFTTQPVQNNHPTVKPIKLMSYLITLGSRENDIVLDPFMGSGSTGVACKILNHKFIGIEKEEQYMKIAQTRIKGTE
jgi:site-specific DNA-methyltransferase (adenine-specific)